MSGEGSVKTMSSRLRGAGGRTGWRRLHAPGKAQGQMGGFTAGNPLFAELRRIAAATERADKADKQVKAQRVKGREQ